MQGGSYLVISITGSHHLDIVQTWTLMSGRLIWMFLRNWVGLMVRLLLSLLIIHAEHVVHSAWILF